MASSTLLTMMYVHMYSYTFYGRNKGQNLLAIFENMTFCRLLISVPLKMYSKFGLDFG